MGSWSVVALGAIRSDAVRRPSRFHENARLGSHADRAFCGKRGLVKPAKTPRLAATGVANMLTVATNAIFIRGGDLRRSWGTLSLENIVFNVGGALRAATSSAKG